MEEYIKAFKAQLKLSKPSFTEYSLRETIAKIIISIDKKDFMTIVPEEEINSVLNEIKNQNIEINIRKQKGEK